MPTATGRYVVAGLNGTIITSPDGITWTSRSTPGANHRMASAWSPEQKLFVVVGYDGTILTSPDGIAWTSRSSGSARNLTAATWSSEVGLFVVGGGVGTILTSPDGITWTSQSSGTSDPYDCVVWSPEVGLFVAGAANAFGNIRTSPDAVTWSGRSAPNDFQRRGIDWSPEVGLFVLVGGGGSVLISSDGIKWVDRSPLGITEDLYGVVWSPEVGLFVVAGYSGTILTSPDGSTWTSRTTPITDNLHTATWSPEVALFVVGGANGTAITSPDGISWTNRSTPGTDGRFGAVWAVLNQPPTAPTVTAPNGGETWDAVHTITWTAGSDPDGDALVYDIDLTVDGGSSWSRIVTGAAGTSVDYDFSSAPASTACRVRIRARDTGGLTSAWDESDANFEISHNDPPNAPILVNPVNGQIIDRAATQRFDWDFSDPNTDDTQSRSQGEIRARGTTTVLYSWDEETPNTYHDVAGGTLADGGYEWRARTFDSVGEVGPWSTWEPFDAATAPNPPSITDPVSGQTIGADSYVVAWSTTSQTAFQVRTVADNAGTPDPTTVYEDTLEQTSASARNRQMAFPVNDRWEWIQVRIKRDGLWSAWGEVRVHVSYTPPAASTVTLTADSPAGAIAVGVQPGPWPASVSAVTFTGTGNGGIDGPTVTDGETGAHNWEAVCVATAADGGTFDVTVDGTVVGQATVGTPFTHEGCTFTINDGTTDYALNDTFTWSTYAVKTTSHDVHRRQVGDTGAGIRIAAGIAATATHTDRSVASGVHYEYRVRAYGDNGVSSYSAWTE